MKNTFLKRIDRENRNNGGLIVQKSKKKGSQGRKSPIDPRTNIICFG
jgi:hypothetical protein